MNIEDITICGGGNGAHALWALLASKEDLNLNLYLPLEEEFQSFRKAKEKGVPFEIVYEKDTHRVSMDRLAVTKNPKVVGSADMVIMVIPAFAHRNVLEKIVSYLKSGTIVAALPSRSGFEFQAANILKEKDKSGVIIAGFQTLPWACRIRKYAQSVEILGQKDRVYLTALPGNYSDFFTNNLSQLLGLNLTSYNNMLELTLGNQGQIIHPGIMYGAFSDKLEELYRKKDIPLFYQSVDREAAEILEAISREIINTRESIEDNFDIKLDGVVPIEQWMLGSYSKDIGDKSTLYKMFQTNRAYKGLKVPVKQSGDGLYKVDVNSRYLTEDVPYGLIVSKAIAELAGVNTPTIDEVITTVSNWLGKQYLIDGKLRGEDLAETRIPQNFGFNHLNTIIKLVSK